MNDRTQDLQEQENHAMPRFPKGTSRIAIGLALAAALGACNAPNDDSAATGPATDAADDSAAATATAGTGAAAGEALPLTGQAFVDAASASDQFELESARIVQSKGITGELRAFAQMMIRDHTASSNALQAAASKVQGVQLRQTPLLTAAQQSQLDQLKAATGDSAPALYIRQQLEAHEKAYAMLTTYASSGDSKPLMDFAAKTAPVVQKHLGDVRKMQP
jgi:putative membrane protein